jgi:hypothetical protein
MHCHAQLHALRYHENEWLTGVYLNPTGFQFCVQHENAAAKRYRLANFVDKIGNTTMDNIAACSNLGKPVLSNMQIPLGIRYFNEDCGRFVDLDGDNRIDAGTHYKYGTHR